MHTLQMQGVLKKTFLNYHEQLKMHFEDHYHIIPLELILLEKCWKS